jgi:alkanesulfonate monooxygenase SsuD/methylene tetrahydromethanopterin reductase-like flavin-dependent oxidoreductase (luciferase family)
METRTKSVAPRVGLLLPQYGCDVETTMASARAADAARLDIWIAGQLFPISEKPEKESFEPLSLMGALAAATERSRLGFMVLAAPYYSSIFLAKALVTLDHISGGRIEVGLGAGWRQDEFAALDVPFASGERRRAQLEERIDAIEAIANGRTARSEAGTEVRSGPGSLQTTLPLWVAGSGPKVLEMVGRRAAWANFARGISVDAFVAAAEIVKSSAAAAGRSDGGPRLSLTGTFLGAPTEDELAARVADRAKPRQRDAAEYRDALLASNALVGSPAAIAAQLGPYIEAGCEAVILWPLDGNHADAPKTLGEVRSQLE